MDATHTVYEAGRPAERFFEWGKGYVTPSTDTLGYPSDKSAVESFLCGFLMGNMNRGEG